MVTLAKPISAEAAIDGFIGGYTADGLGNYQQEWATNGGGVGSTITLNWGR